MVQVPISMASWLLLLLLVGGSCVEAPYLSVGDGSALEFEFPERSRGIMVVSSRYGGNSTGTGQPRLRVASLAPDVLAVENISALCCGASGFLVAIRSGPAGLAPLQLRLLDRQHLVEERCDYRVRVAAAVVPVPALGHFSENPVLYVLLPLIFLNKCAFGCKVEAEALRGLARRPQPVLLGIVGQFVAMPLYGYLLSWALALPQGLALGLVITCSSPGGGGGYLYSLLLGGDVTLAISMTLLSTVAAAGLMPLSWALYGRLLSAPPGLHVPVGKILGTLLFIAAPISTGIVIKCKLPRVARLLLLLLKPFSFLLLLGGLAMAYHMGAVILAEAQAPVVLAGLTVPAVGLLLGYGLAAGLGLPGPHRRTVAIEVGVQNSLLALAVLQLSFRRHQADMASQAPFVVALSGTSEMLILVLGNLLYQRLWPPPGP
ncbi:P3 protein [Alligator sinensis]|uniref:P3 protein n=1 Tax=Alligator sinensis TaxID=38654 RepID=A0A1U8DCL5_ALLSI|nr:P3 protein [Alligator sinensis]XP_014378071.1 P3 protein [Alligator sinensis]XP_025066583.1 P3 protein [Alligator sinensis]